MFKISAFLSIVAIAFFSIVSTKCFGQSTGGVYISEVISYTKGSVITSDDPSRFDPVRALGAPVFDTNYFTSLGFGGELAVKFSAPVKNGNGNDFHIYETSWGNPDCNNWPEKVQVSASKDNITWIVVDTVCQSGAFNLPAELDWILYLKLKDISDPNSPSWYSNNIDGYDVNAIESLHGYFGAVVPSLECIINNNNGTYTAILGYENQDDIVFTIPIGTRNFFSNSLDKGQPEEFLPGIHANDFFIEFDGNPLVWTLKGPDSVSRTVQFSSSSTLCPIELPTAEISGDAQLCSAEEEATISISLTGTAPWTIVYNSGEGEDITVSGITSSPYTFKTNESKTFTLVKVTDANGEGAVKGSATVIIKDPINPEFSVPEKIEVNKPVTFTPEQQDGETYSWSISDAVVSDQQILEHSFLSEGNYNITLTIQKDGCENSLTKPVVVEDLRKSLYIPNVFSPWASNPENQVVKVYGLGISPDDFHFRIINRWGNVLFETYSLDVAQNVGWDGKAKGTGEMQALGVYTFMLRGKFVDGETFKKTGSILLAK